MLAFPRTACFHASVHQSLSYCCSFPATGCFAKPRLVGVAKSLQEQERDGSVTDFSPPHRTIGSPLSRLPSPARYPCLQTSDDGDLTTDGSAAESTFHKRGEGVEAAGVTRVLMTLTSLLPPMEKEKKKGWIFQ